MCKTSRQGSVKGAGPMGKLSEAAVFYAKFAGKVLPEAYRQRSLAREELRQCLPVSPVRRDTIQEDSFTGRFSVKKACCFLFSMCPGTDARDMLSFVLSLHSIDEYLEVYRKKKDIRDEKEIRDLLGCLSAAVDPSAKLSCKLPDAGMRCQAEQSKNRKVAMCQAEQCRLKLAVLPSYRHVASVVGKYMQMYIEMQSYRHYPAIISTDLLRTWSSVYLKRFQDISWWELCAASDTFLGISAMFAAASVADITEEEVLLLDEFCFPWLSGLCSLLDSLISARMSLNAEELNFSSFYKNLRECEERLIFFAENAESACRRLKGSSLYLLITKAAAGLYVSDPEACFGMLRLAILNMISKTSLRLHRNAGLLLRTFRLL